MEQVKKKRGRPKKVKLPQEIQDLVTQVESKKETPIKQDKPKEISTVSENDWDFKIGDDIKFFDPTKSYELSGYKLIDDTHGLEFDPNWFLEARNTFIRTGHYCEFRFGSKAFNDFWDIQFDRCRNGMTSHGYTITGDHYFFLNFYQLPNLHTAKAGTGRMIDFPDFYIAQYIWFHYLELCKQLRKNAALMKARGLGFSEMNASLAANMYTVRDNSTTLIAANLQKYVEDTISKVWSALSFLNDKTDDGFSQLSQVVNNSMMRKASYIENRNGMKIEAGSMSLIKGIVADSPNKIRGDRCDLLLYEEGGSWVNSTKAFIQGDALIHIQGEQFGIKVIGGTGGDSGNRLEGLRTIYYNPDAFNVLPYKHHYTQTNEEVLTGFFLPAFSIVKGEYMDSRGYTNPEKGREYYDVQRSRFTKSPKDLITYCAEYCYNAEEAFNLEGDNKFNKVNIAEQLVQIRALKKAPPIERGYIEYRYKEGIHNVDNITGFKWILNQNSNIQILEHPIWTLPEKTDENGKVIWRPPAEKIRDLYIIGVDGIDIGMSQTSEYTKDPSDFCLVVYKRVYGLDEPKIVALYKDRPDDVRECYKITIKLAQYYNARINVEATRQSIISYARREKLLNLFMKRPRATLSDAVRNTNRQYGTPATAAIIDHQTDLIADYVNDYCHQIWFEDVLDELNRYSDENKRKFDIIAALGMAMLADEELQGAVPRLVETVKETWQDIGFYTDDQGRRRYGTIPKQSTQIRFNNNFGQLYDSIGPRTSDPRIYSGYL